MVLIWFKNIDKSSNLKLDIWSFLPLHHCFLKYSPLGKISFTSHVKFHINQPNYRLEFRGIKGYFRKSNFLSNRGLMFHWNTHHHPWLHENDRKVVPYGWNVETSESTSLRGCSQEWHVKFYANVAGRRASHMQRGSDIRYIFSWRYILS